MGSGRAITTEVDEGESAVFDRAAELFGMLATPMRLRILSALCET
jgi:DNA-binding transcriptional ArsR family regulator